LINLPIILRISSSQKQKAPLVVIISKKTAPKATKRNLLRRRIKNILQLPSSSNKKFLVVVKPSAFLISYQELEKILKEEYARITGSSNRC